LFCAPLTSALRPAHTFSLAQRFAHGSGFDPASLGLREGFRMTDYSKLKG
jgi:hypothetical protein